MPEQRRTNHGNGKYRDMPLELAHVQPQATEMEKAVLGALMIDRDAYMEVCNLLRVESFYEPRNQMVYEAIVKLNAEESPVDVLTVTDKLGKMGRSLRVVSPTSGTPTIMVVCIFRRIVWIWAKNERSKSAES